MNSYNDRLGTNRWTLCFWDELYESLDEIGENRAGNVAKGILMLPPPFCDLLIEYGIVDSMNDSLGTLIDLAEEEEIDVEKLLEASSIVARFANEIRNTRDSVLRMIVGQVTEPRSQAMIAEMQKKEFVTYLTLLAEFLEDASKQGKPVTIAL